MWVKDAVIFSNYDCIPFKKSVSLMTSQKKLKRSVGEADRCLFSYFPGITKLGIVWVGHFA